MVALEPPDLIDERESKLAYFRPATTCNREGRCVIIDSRSVDDSTFGRTVRLFKRFFGEARHRPVRR
jgi:hypothetical protein